MLSNKMLPYAFVILLVMLGIIWWPSFNNLGNLMGYANTASYNGITLMRFFQGIIVILVTVWVVLLSYKPANKPMYGFELIRKHLVLMVFIIGQVFMGFIAGGFLVHQDASWYQVVHGSDEVMPAQAVILLICYPLYLFFGGGAYLYAKSRLPAYAKDKQVAFMVLTFTPLAFLPYYDASIVAVKTDMADLLYLLSYWVLSTAWLVIGVLFLVLGSAKEFLKGLKYPYEEV